MAEPSPTTLSSKVFRDSEEQWFPHWQRFDDSDDLEPLVNSAGGLFPKPIVKPISVAVYHIDMWKTGYTDAHYKNELNATNESTWLSAWEPGQAWISRIIWEEEETNGTDVQRVQYVIKCNEFGWDNDFIQMGYYYKSGSDNLSFQTNDGIPYIGLLDEDGEEAGSAEIAGDKLKRRIDFSASGL